MHGSTALQVLLTATTIQRPEEAQPPAALVWTASAMFRGITYGRSHLPHILCNVRVEKGKEEVAVLAGCWLLAVHVLADATSYVCLRT
jgi:hypothetical protein